MLQYAKRMIPMYGWIQLPSVSGVFKYSEQVASAADAPFDLTVGTTTHNFIATPEAVKLNSSDAADASAGANLQTCRVIGLDSNGYEQTEDIPMNGTGDANGSLIFSAINELRGLEFGANKVNAGAITLTGLSSGNTLGTIAAGENDSHMAIYTVPSSYRRARLYYAELKVREAANGEADVDLMVWYPDTEAWVTQYTLTASTNNQFNKTFDAPIIVIPPLGRVKLRVKNLTGTGLVVNGGFTLVLER